MLWLMLVWMLVWLLLDPFLYWQSQRCSTSMWSLQINHWNKNTILDSVFILNKFFVRYSRFWFNLLKWNPYSLTSNWLWHCYHSIGGKNSFPFLNAVLHVVRPSFTTVHHDLSLDKTEKNVILVARFGISKRNFRKIHNALSGNDRVLLFQT